MRSWNLSLRKCLSLSMVVIMLLAIGFTGCGSKNSDKKVPENTKETNTKEIKTIKVQWIGDFKMEDSTDKISGKKVKGISILKDEFEKQHPDIKVEFVIMSWDDYTQKTQAMLMSNQCDVYQVPAIANIASQGLLEPLQKYIERDKFDMSVYIDGQIDGWKAVGPEDKELQIYGFPFIGDTRFISYDKKIFDEWKVPYLSKNPTPEEILEAAKKMTGKNPVTGKDNYGLFFKGGDAADSIMNLNEAFGNSWGSGIRFNELKFNFDSPEMLKALKFLKELSKYSPKGVMAGQGGELWGTPDNNIAIHLRAHPGDAYNIEGVDLSDRFAASFLFVNPKVEKGGMFAGSPYCIGKSSKNKDAAWEYLKFSSTEFFQKYMWEHQRIQSTPVIKAALNWDSIKSQPIAKTMVESMARLWTPRYIYRAAQPRYILSSAVEEAMLDKISPEEALKKAQKEADDWVKQQK